MPQITYRPGVIKQLKRIPWVERRKIIRKLEILAEDPNIGKLLYGEYKGLSSIRAWPYRIVYKIMRSSIVVYSVRHRQESYKK